MHFDGTITLGQVLTLLGAVVAVLFFWRDTDWRISNLETWRKEHMVDEEARDKLIHAARISLDHLRWQTKAIAKLSGLKLPDIDERDDP